jgi:outer membrane protein TolC
MVGAARAQWRAAVEKYRVDTAWANPEVMVEGMYMTDGLGDRVRPDDWLVRFTQDIPLPGKLGAAGRISEADARIGRLRVDGAARDLVVALRESFHELLYIREARRIASLNRELLDRVRTVGEGAYAANRAALVDVMKAQAQSGQLLYDTILLDELERTEKTRLNGLLNRPADAPLGPLVESPLLPVAYDLPEIRAFAEGSLEEIRIAGEGVAKAESMVSLARYENLPELNVGVSGGKQNGADQVGAQVGIMLPIWYGKNAGRTEGAKADLEAMRAMRESRVNDTRAMVSDTFFRLRNSERLVGLYRDDLLPQAARAVESAEELYRQGQGSFSDYVETQSAWYSFQLSLARAKADHGKFLGRLEGLAGRELTRREEGAGKGSAAPEGAFDPAAGKEVAR